jgi:AsmA protein
MQKGMKTTGVIILSIILFVLVAAFALPYFISLDKYKGMVEEQLEAALQRDCSLGKLRVTILPTMGAKIQDLVISNPSGFSETPLLSLKTVKVRVKIIPLLFGKTKIAGLTLRHPEVFIEKDSRGRSNIPYMEKAGTSDRRGTLKSGKVKTEKSQALKDFSLAKASIRDGKFIYLDRSTTPQRRTEIERIDLDLRNLELKKKIQYKLSLHWSPGAVTLEGSAGPLGDTIDITSIPLEGELRADFPKLDGLMQQLTGESESAIQGALKADVEFKGDTGSTLTAQGEILLKDFSLGEKGKRSIEYLDVQLTPEIEVSKGAERLQLTATLLLDKTPILINGQFRDLQRKPVGKLTLASQESIDLEELGPKFPAMNQAATIKGKLDLTGDLIVPGQGTPLFSMDATSPRMDITLAKKKKAKEQKAPTQAPPQEKKPATKKGQRRSTLDARGSFKVTEGTFEGSAFKDLICMGEMRGGEIKITRFSFGAFDGTLVGAGTINIAQEPAAYNIKAKVTDVDANTIFSTLVSWKNMLKGTFSGDIALGGEGLSIDSIKKNLTGNGLVNVKDGELTWVNLVGRIVQALGGKGFEKEKTTFEDLTGNFTVKNGMINLPNLLISHENMDLKLWGDIGLDMKLKMDGEAHLPQSVTGDISGKGWRFFSDDQGRLTIPFSLKGNVQDPKVGISTRLIEQGVKGVLEELLKKKNDK